MTVQDIKHRYGIVGNSPEINTSVEVAMQVAPTEVTVLVQGENGTGKDVFSRIIHQFSKRKHKPFLAVNTGAIPEGTLDSELFGHEKGAFTSAYDSRKGYFEEVEGGTIFLDEIGEMPLATQARLLRLLENGEYLRVGSSKIRKADVRVIAATNKNLMDMIRRGKFREDLFFRLNTVSIPVPALRDRGDDIQLLFRYFAMEFGEQYQRDALELDEEAVPILHKYRWPGNVRELRNLVEKLTVLVKEDVVSPTVLQRNLLVQDSYLPSVVRLQDGYGEGNANDDQGRDDGYSGFSPRDRDMLFKLLMDLGREVTDLKRMMYLNMQNRDFAPAGLPPAIDSGRYRHQEHYPDEENFHPAAYVVPDQPRAGKTPLLVDEPLSLEIKEKEMITKALKKHNNNRKKAAAELGISERTLYRKLKTYEIDA